MAPIPSLEQPGSELALKNLGSLLGRLDRTLSASSNESLDQQNNLSSPYERQKVRMNFEYARALLLRLEHESAGIKIASKKQAIQLDLKAKRDQVKRLQARIQELEQVDEDEASSDEDDLDGETLSSAPAATAALGETTSEQADAPDQEPKYTSTLRQRSGDPQGPTSYSTSVHHANDKSSTDDSSVKTREKILTSDRVEQEQIQESLLALTRELKMSVAQFSSGVEEEKSLLGRAVKGLDRNVDGMDAAGNRMGMLRRMTEGKGWWGRMMLYAYIAGLWLLALVIVFVLPKLRF